MSNWNVLVETAKDEQVTATVVELPELRVTAGDRQTALANIQQLLSERLAKAEIVSISVPTATPENPWVKFGGMFENDSDFADIMCDLQAEKQIEP